MDLLMNVLGRFVHTLQTHVRRWTTDQEDPEQRLEQVVAEMQSDLIQLRQTIAQAIATQKRTERQRQQADQRAQEWYNRAQLALQKGDESQARAALSQRHLYLSVQSQLSAHSREQQTAVTHLKTTMRTLDITIADVRARKDMIIARARSAEASQRLQQMLAQVNVQRSTGAFGDMEEAVWTLEAQAAALEELNTTSPRSLHGHPLPNLDPAAADVIEADLATMQATWLDTSPDQSSPSQPGARGC